MAKKFVLQFLFILFLFSACNMDDYNQTGTPKNLQAVSDTVGIKLTWNAVDDADYYNIYRSDKSSYSPMSETASTTYIDISVYMNDTYTYFVSAYCDSKKTNSDKESEKSTPASCMWVGKKLDEPQNLQAVALSSGIKLTWDAVDGAVSYNIYRSNYSSYSSYGTTSATTWTDSSSNLEIGSTYTYQVSACSNSSYSYSSENESDKASVSCTYYVEDSFNLKAATVSSGVKLTWNSISGANTYNVYRSTSYSSYSYSLLNSTTATTYIDTDSYYSSCYYKVSALSSSGAEIEESSPVQYTKSTVPQNLQVTGITSNSLTLSWDSVSSASSYKLYRSEVSASTVVDIGETITGITYTDTGLTSGTRYYYKVSAILSGGSESEKSASVSAVTRN